MARVKATQYRVVYQYADEALHRLRELDSKTVWYTGDRWDYLEADCPKCPEPEPVECERPEYHDHHAEWARYCPSCGKRLREA